MTRLIIGYLHMSRCRELVEELFVRYVTSLTPSVALAVALRHCCAPRHFYYYSSVTDAMIYRHRERHTTRLYDRVILKAYYIQWLYTTSPRHAHIIHCRHITRGDVAMRDGEYVEYTFR